MFCITIGGIVEDVKLTTAMDFWCKYRNLGVWGMKVDEVHAPADREL